ncbi:hypothetical protein [Glutamicibacter sp. NPDC087583]|uniref:hypothetical protein n=1 Tax=Glutamicibacter sp. NPDC087583 TaxID=3363995 RepID=UPI003810B525
MLDLEAQHLGIERFSFRLIIHAHTSDINPHYFLLSVPAHAATRDFPRLAGFYLSIWFRQVKITEAALKSPALYSREKQQEIID